MGYARRKVAFYTGILPVCQDELGVAVVMGHEVAHAVAKHGQERMNTAYAQQIGLSLGSVALGQDPTMAQQLVFQAVGLGSQLGMLAFSRKHESEADELGLIFMAIAGYDQERLQSSGKECLAMVVEHHRSFFLLTLRTQQELVISMLKWPKL